MKYLTIIRHAKSSWDDPGQEDIFRPLNQRGRAALGIIGKFLKEKEIQPDLIITSPATRALQTAGGIAGFLHYPQEKMEINKVIYYGDVQGIISVLKEIQENYNDVLLFGHEPLLSGLIHRFSGEALPKFSTCAVYRMSFNIKKWADIISKKGKCEFYVYPKLLQKD